MLKLIFLLALAYLVYRLLSSLGRGAPRGHLGTSDRPAGPSIDRSRVVDAEYREADGEADGEGEAESGPRQAP